MESGDAREQNTTARGASPHGDPGGGDSSPLGTTRAVSASGNGQDFRGNQGSGHPFSPLQPQLRMLLNTPLPPVPLSAANSSFQQQTLGIWQRPWLRRQTLHPEQLSSAFPEVKSPRVDVQEFPGEFLQ